MEKLILLFLLFLVTAAILDIRPDSILQFYNSETLVPGDAPREILEL